MAQENKQAAAVTAGPVVLITGGAGTIGLAIARHFAAQGARVALMDRQPLAAMQALRQELLQAGAAGVTLISGDLAELEAHEDWLRQIETELGDSVHCLVNNAGVGAVQRADMLALTPEAFDAVMDINLRGTFFLTQAVMKRFLAQEQAAHPRSIITVSSISVEAASTERAEYCISKSGLGMLTRLAALRLAAAGIPVFELRPGITHSGMTQVVAPRYDRLIADGLVPAGRWGEGEDMAGMVTALASGAFAFATGTVIQADGGLMIPRL
ncbi:3-ketoacyl-ACP reductase [Kerstersia sp.]|uniref:3-ketoacyl-ACP reductase n=1 Tax=Kerstersia sp. TaxID=1930783 RepID=UPI003F90DACC